MAFVAAAFSDEDCETHLQDRWLICTGRNTQWASECHSGKNEF